MNDLSNLVEKNSFLSSDYYKLWYTHEINMLNDNKSHYNIFSVWTVDYSLVGAQLVSGVWWVAGLYSCTAGELIGSMVTITLSALYFYTDLFNK